MTDARTPCPAEGCPGLEWHDGRPVGCGHPTKTGDCEGLRTEEYRRWQRPDTQGAWPALVVDALLRDAHRSTLRPGQLHVRAGAPRHVALDDLLSDGAIEGAADAIAQRQRRPTGPEQRALARRALAGALAVALGLGPPNLDADRPCRVYWGSHGCRLERGHAEPHLCACVADEDHDEHGVGAPPYYGPDTVFYGEDA